MEDVEESSARGARNAASRGPGAHHGRGPGGPPADGPVPADGGGLRPPLREATRVHPDPDGPAPRLSRGGFGGELLRRRHRRRERRGLLRCLGARRGPRVSTVHSSGPDGAAPRLGAGILPAERHRALAQRADRYAPVSAGAAHGGRRDRGGGDGDARAGRRPDRLHRQALAAPGHAGARRRRGSRANTFRIRLEYAIMVTFLYDQAYECNEYCKYYKNIEARTTSSFRRSTAPPTTAASAT